MKRIHRILLLLLLLLILPGSLLTAGLFLPQYYKDSYYAELAAMRQRIRSAEGPRLIVLGNSDVAFGLDGALLESLLSEKGFSYTVCPFGLYGAVGTSAMLSLSERELREGDLVVIVAEPVSETLSDYFGATAFWKCAESDPSLLLALNADQRRAMLGNAIGFLQTRFAYRQSGTAPMVQGVYAKASFDERCDLVYDRPGNTMPLGYNASQPVTLSEVTMSEAFCEQIAAYCRTAERVGTIVLLSFSPLNRAALTDPDQVLPYFSRIRDAFPCPVISDPNRYLMDSGWFYDSNFHLNSAGAVVRTLELARDVAAYLGCTEPIDCPLPEMPAPVYSVSESAGDEKAFTYAPVGDAAYLIERLTAEGKEHAALTVPALYKGKPVIGFMPSALSDAAVLEDLTLPPSIEALPDGLFSSCPSLVRLVLTHTQKPCEVSQHTFDGADRLRILVPSAAYPLYRDGYGCAQNPWEPFLNRIEPY